jgi:hypothetical protein
MRVRNELEIRSCGKGVIDLVVAVEHKAPSGVHARQPVRIGLHGSHSSEPQPFGSLAAFAQRQIQPKAEVAIFCYPPTHLLFLKFINFSPLKIDVP